MSLLVGRSLRTLVRITSPSMWFCRNDSASSAFNYSAAAGTRSRIAAAFELPYTCDNNITRKYSALYAHELLLGSPTAPPNRALRGNEARKLVHEHPSALT